MSGRNNMRKRKGRVPFGVARQQLKVEDNPGKMSRWINDDGDRIQRALAGDYTFRTDDGVQVGDPGTSGNENLGSRISKVVGMKKDGTPLHAFLMEIDKELYESDPSSPDREHMYVPKEGIHIKRK
jgi:hypothetical protein